ncbi:universal stress protein PHOS34-like [Hordeum vulgare subsp. vulgare]|uniref:UspA domain-containing protein n=1 Tax=Hordeum vulgare subsp. vulgare TaxID=112509 RepID=A0A8I7BDX0_HORVV|nr:universal stress protein PHOS34-like [Hordeum vulgare subsp. vulgare]
MAAEGEALMAAERAETSTAPAAAATESAANGKPAASWKPAMVLGIDESEHSYYALEWTIHHFFAPGQPQQYHLIVVSAKPPAASVIGIAGIGTAELLPKVELDLKRASARVIDKAKEHCSHVTDVSYEVKEGDARNVLCEAVERHHADMLVMGSHGYGAFKRAVLGSVSDYCTHNAHCTVMIVKQPKHHKKHEQLGFHRKDA